VEFKNGIPVAPTGLANRPLPKMPMEFDTGEGMRIRVSAVANGLAYPFGAAFLPDGSMLVTEREGHLRIIRNGVLDPQPVAGTPPSYFAGESGLPGAIHGYMDVVLHPRFNENKLIYLSYTKPLDDKARTLAVARGTWDGKAIKDMKDIFVAKDSPRWRASPSIATTCSTSRPPRPDPATRRRIRRARGKGAALADDGSVPKTIRSWGRKAICLSSSRSVIAARWPRTASAHGEMWLNENGPNGGDEINVLVAGKNYGWPTVSYGRSYTGPWQSEIPGTRVRTADRLLGTRESPCRAWRSIRATVSRSGRATCSWARCARARFPAPATSSAFCSTRRWKNFVASRC
jgi:hypothetical protein